VAGRTQQQLARAIGLHPDVLSHKMNGRDGAVLTTADVIAIVTVLAEWGALAGQADATELLSLMAVPPRAVPAAAWTRPPLAALPDGGVAGLAAAVAARSRRRMTPPPLPAPATALIGRERELAAIAAALESARLVTLTGPGGTGKTRLALAAGAALAGRFHAGAAFVDLAPFSDPGLLASGIASSLGLTPPSASAAEGLLTEALRDQELLLILDNLEQLLDGAPLIARILTAARDLRVLATSRIALRLYGEHTMRVPPLSLPGPGPGTDPCGSEAVRLFIARARALRPDFEPGADGLADVTAVCAALDGLPLAIELAAARTALYPPGALVPLLGSRLALLTGGPRDLPQRQRTLRATLDWSHRLLPDAGRHLFACLGVFAGPFDAAAAAAVSGVPGHWEVLDRLAELTEQSMLEVTPGPAPRFHLLRTVREYALARLAESGALDEARRRHLGHYLAVTEASRRGLTRASPAAAVEEMQADDPDIRAALEFACAEAGTDDRCLEAGLRLAAAVCPLWRLRAALAESEPLVRRLLALDDARHRGDDALPAIRSFTRADQCP
jgi:predicted ATPase